MGVSREQRVVCDKCGTAFRPSRNREEKSLTNEGVLVVALICPKCDTVYPLYAKDEHVLARDAEIKERIAEGKPYRDLMMVNRRDIARLIHKYRQVFLNMGPVYHFPGENYREDELPGK